nr:MAG TPA: TMEM210 family [Caudoviricetes sp.]DAN81607.1 MAG TPA: TMEM210 family [Caudoviricetes sp.]
MILLVLIGIGAVLAGVSFVCFVARGLCLSEYE